MKTTTKTPSWFLATTLIAALLTQVGCLSWFSDKVATGVARLTVRNVAAMISAVNLDETCGFANTDINENPVFDGEVGGIGSGTWRVEECTIDYGDTWKRLSQDCEGNTMIAKGAITITVEKIVRGRVTGNPEKPIIPFESEAVTFRIIKAVPTNFHVAKSNNDNWMRMRSGVVSANVSVKLVQAESNGLCSVVTPNVQISDILYSQGDVHVHTPDNSFDVEVESSNMTAVNGVYGDKENHLSGTLTIFGDAEKVPMDGDNDGLDPEYNAEKFKETYLCTNDLRLPEVDSCDLTERMGEAVSRLGLRNFGTLIKYLGSDTTCGFESPAVKANPEFFGAVGYNGGEVTYTLDNCKVDFPEVTELFTDCMGKIISVQGTAIVSGTKVVTGYLTGDPDTPVVPASSTPGVVTIRAVMDNFKVIDSNSPKILTLKTGILSGTLTPRMMIDTKTGACAAPTSHAKFSNVELSNSSIRLNSSGNLLDAEIKSFDLYAVNGVFGDEENHLEGSVIINDTPVVVPLDTAGHVLDPDYHPIAFVETFDCKPDTIIPQTEDDCSFRSVLAQGAARLLVKNFGVVTKTVDLDKECGFGNTMALLSGLLDTELLASYMSGTPYTATWNVNQCNLNHSKNDADVPGFELDPVLVQADCEGTAIMIRGQATVTSTKNVTGAVVVSYPPLHPQNRQSAQFRHSEIIFDDFAAYEVKEGDTEAAGPYLIIHSGTMTGISNPVTGESDSNEGAYFIKTPVAGFENVSITDSEATLVLGKKTFHFTLNQSDLDAFNGSFEGTENFLNGNLTFDGHGVAIPVNPEDSTLNPNYDQAAFDATYVCKDDLKETVPAAQ